MAIVLEGCTTEEQRTVVRFLCAKGLNAKEINKEIYHVYGGKCLSRIEVHNWIEKFSQARSKFADDAWPGRPVKIAAEASQKTCMLRVSTHW
jgi:transposase